jgi:hypothetical protein
MVRICKDTVGNQQPSYFDVFLSISLREPSKSAVHRLNGSGCDSSFGRVFFTSLEEKKMGRNRPGKKTNRRRNLQRKKSISLKI